MTELTEGDLQREGFSGRAFTSPTMEALTTLVQRGVMEEASREDPWEIRVLPIIELLEEVDGRHPDYKTLPDSPPVEDLRAMLPGAFTGACDSFVEKGVIPGSLRELVRSRLLNDGNITAEESDSSAFWFGEYYFPSNPENAALFSVGNKCVAIFEARIAGALNRCGVKVEPEVLKRVAIDTVVSHEYGHVVDWTFIILAAGREKEVRGLEERMYQVPFKLYMEIGEAGKERIHRGIYRDIAPNREVEVALRGDEGAVSESTVDRVSTGFEILGLQFALEREGVSPEDALRASDTYRAEASLYLADYRVFRDTLDEHGLDLKKVEKALGVVQHLLGEFGANRKDLVPLVDPMGGVGGRKVGYYAPMTRTEVDRYIRTNLPLTGVMV
ncbi:MAG: hypothetical protein A2700_00915 [Candidatus Blackburnbacteria bacterium RIFCSPHIGHO2_01_FULL_44_64]|uniref:Uncharacterized protein n=1 Tax=Candidatus Blackburnbacteria bacterium RIFCSPHIGHO2_02_FULL_44_20 TaxID=1797516 RepID=A0A1G1V661_9BACT|nr:MAG: hypothetical protein A2700_00915 [Candidatus Blackburnbacteria bacterium RIFCSPHIGHO2_01_FULL_44_64]OGY10879.1 MAG: hypothetical protein A3E16_03150 [Candidatus Blackburnbacteria bacterium RIFCSPHIGHO2_12_FULL_44_25]OGY10905.1 MAG: hypothetical protein A3D26_01720 [Candidatus Blackburnbacteria bacterium RIFCSPHIGHO2_02_FULL_44_20]OGY15901.1 MAG: hypothetical protein A3H88_02315 [Candidatus Blackburnbacteria bacterium RIFCSPLOWO2_02_FULL_44_9]